MIRPLLLATATLAAAPALAKQPVGWPADQVGQETAIPFVDTVRLSDFEADGDRGVWIQDQARKWYYARIVGLCTGLPFATRIGVDTRFGGTQLDRTGRLLVDGERCSIDSLTKSAGPPPNISKPKNG